MGNYQSSDKETLIQDLWKTQRAIAVLPLNRNLDALRVLTKQSNGYHVIGNVNSLSKPGQNHGQQHKPLSTRSLGQQSYTISDDDGEVAIKLTDTPAWFNGATSTEIRISECLVREYNMDDWDEMVSRFCPDMDKVNTDQSSREQELFIVQKVVLVSHITITASYNPSARPDVRSPVMLPSGLQIEPRNRGIDRIEFTISDSQRNRKLPIAFSGFKHTYNKFGDLKVEHRTQADTAGASSGQDAGVEADGDDDGDDDEDSEDDEEDVPANDAIMGDFFVGDGDWCTQLITDYNPLQHEIFDPCEEDDQHPPPPPPPSPPGSPRAPGSPQHMEDID